MIPSATTMLFVCLMICRQDIRFRYFVFIFTFFLDSTTPKTWVSTLEFHRYPIPLYSYNYFRSGKGQFPFPGTYHCQSVLAIGPLDSTTPKTWVSTLEFHIYPIPLYSYNYFWSGKGQLPFPGTYHCLSVSTICPFDSATPIT